MAGWIRYKYMGADLIDWDIESLSGYKPITTFYTDFGIAERFGEDAIKETYDNAIKYWFDDIKYATEIVMVLNWKIWEHFYAGNEKIARLYDSLWKETQGKIIEKYENDDEALSYYYRTVD